MTRIINILVFLLIFFSSYAVFSQTTVTKTFSPPATIDGSFTFLDLEFDSSDFPDGCIISNVSLSINWRKVSGSCDTPNRFNAYHQETAFSLFNPAPGATEVVIASPNTWSGGSFMPDYITTNFDDSFTTTPSGTPVDGDFSPEESLSAFNGTNPVGIWNLRVEDTVNRDPLCIASFSITITTTSAPPVITCPTPESSYNTDTDECNYTGTFEATATDDCGVDSFTYTVDGSAISYPYDFPVGTTTVTAIATDIYGNTSNPCSFDIVVVDNQPPNTVVLPPVTLECEDSLSIPSTTDNCSGSINGTTTNPLTYDTTGTYTVNWTFEDDATNSITVQQEVNVNGCIDLSLRKTVDNALPKVGDNITFSVTIRNSGPSEATGVEVEDVIPPDLSYVSHTAPASTTYSQMSGIWNLPSIPNGSSFVLTITVSVDNPVQRTNVARVVKADQKDVDSVPNNE